MAYSSLSRKTGPSEWRMLRLWSATKYLVKGRNYVAPIGFSVKDDLKYGAQGIDEWVKLDGGNAYILTNYKWVTVDQNGATQLHMEFDTLKCE